MSPALWCIVLFVRLDAATLLQHSFRRSLVDALRGRPGLRLGELADELHVDAKTVLYHARVLARAGALVLAEEGRARRLYLPGAPRRPAPAPRVVRALDAVRAGARTPAALARALALPRGTAGSLLEAMARAGLVERAAEGWRLTRLAERDLAPPGPGSFAS